MGDPWGFPEVIIKAKIEKRTAKMQKKNEIIND